MNEKKRTGQDRKKSQKGYVSPICLAGDDLDVITCAKFQNEIFRGYDYTGGRIFHFPIDF